MSPIVRYSVLRFALFALAVVVLWVAGARGIMLLLTAAIVSLALSYVLLGRARDEVAASLADRAGRRTQAHHDPDAAAEDAEAEGRPASGDSPDDDRRPPAVEG